MPILDAKPRSWVAYLAGIGVSGVLMASALALFVILVGVLTLKTWPHARGLLGNGGADATLRTSATPAPQARAHGSTLNLANLLGAGPGASRPGGTGGGNGLSPGDQGGSGGSTGLPGDGGGQPRGAEQPPAQSQQPSNALSQALSGVGNTVQSTTDTLGNGLAGSSSPGPGGLIGGVGRTLNSDLQSLAGEH